MSIDITCLCDNNVMLSSHLKGEHGISFYIDNGSEVVLFDTGQSFDVLSHNANELGIDLRKVEKVVLSHGHYDHTGGLDGLLDLCSPSIYAHPDIFQRKYKKVDGEEHYIGIPIDRDSIEARAELFLSKDSLSISDGISTTGEVKRVYAEEGVPDIFILKENEDTAKDEIMDDLSLIVKNEKEAMVLLGCNHSGIMNTFTHVKNLINVPITTMAGGTHLVAADEARMNATIGLFRDKEIEIHGFHCTGDEASFKMREGIGYAFKRGFVGKTFVI